MFIISIPLQLDDCTSLTLSATVILGAPLDLQTLVLRTPDPLDCHHLAFRALFAGALLSRHLTQCFPISASLRPVLSLSNVHRFVGHHRGTVVPAVLIGFVRMMSGEQGQKPKPHIVAVPFIGQGHLIPFLQLSELLASQGLAVSYVTTPANVSRLQPQVDSNLDLRLVSIPIPPTDGLPLEIDGNEEVPFSIALTSCNKLAGPFEQWLEKQSRTDARPPLCIVGDIFTGWAQGVGAKFGIPTVYFHTSGAFGMSVMHSIVNYPPQLTADGDEVFAVPVLSFHVRLSKSELEASMPSYPQQSPAVRCVKERFNQSMQGQGILLNSFSELDHLGIEHLKKLTGRPVWSIGPLLPLDFLSGRRVGMNHRGKPSDISVSECFRWMDSRRSGSVVYVCFGSHCLLNHKQIHALAAGLEGSQQSFIWVIRRPESQSQNNKPECDEVLPEGFEERTKERGLIIWGWAPQLLVLSHRCIGAFLSHCGWNSTVESVGVGVPMITWPMFADQPFNSKLVVEYLGMGTQLLCGGMNGVPSEEDVRVAITKVLVEEEGKCLRRRAQQLRMSAMKAIQEGGSSHTHLLSFLHEMHKLQGNSVMSMHQGTAVTPIGELGTNL